MHIVGLASVCAVLGVLPATVWAQAAYRCTAADGAVTLQQTPCSAGAQTKLEVAPAPRPDSRESRVAFAIALREVFIGMTDEEVARSWGRPSNINRTVTKYGSSEQWVYDRGGIGRGQYLYMENGTLRSIQSSSR